MASGSFPQWVGEYPSRKARRLRAVSADLHTGKF
nr:MAG TPA: hypothetical protein [Caudoviricetes sp.]